MKQKYSDQDVVKLLSNLKNAEQSYPSEMIQSRRETYMQQAAAMAILTKTSGGGTPAGEGGAAASGTGTGTGLFSLRMFFETAERGQVELAAVPVVTDESGRFSVQLGTVRGRLRLVATGGQTIDVATGERVPLESELRAVLFRYHPAYPDEVVVTPLTSLATALGERRFQRGDEEPSYFEAMARAYELLGMHAGGFDLVHTPLHDPGERVVAQEQSRVYHGLVLAAFSSLAARIARESNLAPRSLHAGHLLDALVADASSTLTTASQVAT